MTDLVSLPALAELTLRAGGIVMRHYEAVVESRVKADKSPVTDADEEAEHFILAGLAALAPDIPVISEEAAAAGTLPVISDRFFLVDPLDGTKEFLARNGEFTVNIGLIDAGRPVLGVVYAPAMGRLFYGGAAGAWELTCPPLVEGDTMPDLADSTPIAARTAPDPLVGLWSRSHDTYQADTYRETYGVGLAKIMGSSLKFCIIAAGEADLYPRHGPTSEWDIAAGHAVLAAAGGSVTQLDGKPMVYGKVKDRFLNGSFVARGRSR